jgi:hypothetical protein
VEIAGIVPAPTGSWMSQVARNRVDEFDGFLKEKRDLIHGPTGREVPSKGRGRVRGALPSGAEPSGTRQPTDRGRAAPGLGVYYLPPEAGWTPESLRQGGRLILSRLLEQDGRRHGFILLRNSSKKSSTLTRVVLAASPHSMSRTIRKR